MPILWSFLASAIDGSTFPLSRIFQRFSDIPARTEISFWFSPIWLRRKFIAEPIDGSAIGNRSRSHASISAASSWNSQTRGSVMRASRRLIFSACVIIQKRENKTLHGTPRSVLREFESHLVGVHELMRSPKNPIATRLLWRNGHRCHIRPRTTPETMIRHRGIVRGAIAGMQRVVRHPRQNRPIPPSSHLARR